MKVKCLKEIIMKQGGYRFILGKTYKAMEMVDNDFILVSIPRKGYAKIPKTEFYKYFEVISL